MENEKMWEEFEAWSMKEYPGTLLARTSAGGYRNLYVQMCWLGWQASRESQGSVQPCKIGIYGKAYDGPEVARTYTYQHQPDNVGASKIGKACDLAMRNPGGDSIDLGLSLLKRFEEAGLGIFEVKS